MERGERTTENGAGSGTSLQADSEEVTRKKARTEAVSHSDIIAIGKAQSESFKAGQVKEHLNFWKTLTNDCTMLQMVGGL